MGFNSAFKGLISSLLLRCGDLVRVRSYSVKTFVCLFVCLFGTVGVEICVKLATFDSLPLLYLLRC